MKFFDGIFGKKKQSVTAKTISSNATKIDNGEDEISELVSTSFNDGKSKIINLYKLTKKDLFDHVLIRPNGIFVLQKIKIKGKVKSITENSIIYEDEEVKEFKLNINTLELINEIKQKINIINLDIILFYVYINNNDGLKEIKNPTHISISQLNTKIKMHKSPILLDNNAIINLYSLLKNNSEKYLLKK